MSNTTVKTTFTEKLGYGSASLGDAVAYAFINTFLMFFLTTIAEIPPAIAGTITAVGAIWNAFFNPLMGYFSDKVRTRWGRRRPVIFAFSIPLGISLFLLFTSVDLPIGFKPFYYGFMLMLFWSSYTGFFVPYLALGTVYTSDYDDRTILRLFASFFNMIGTMLSMVMPSALVDWLQNNGFTAEGAWSFTGGFLGLATMLSIMFTVLVSKNKDLPCELVKEESLGLEMQKDHKSILETIKDIFKEYLDLFHMKPLKYLVFASLFSLLAYAMLMSCMMYYLTYNKGLSSYAISGCMLMRTLLSIVFIPIVGKLILKFDKRETLIGFYSIGFLGMCLIRFIDIPGLAGLILYMIFITICTVIYWQIMPSVFYDVCEYDRIVNGKEREGTILSFQGLVEALASGIGVQLLGIILQTAGFVGDAAVQSEKAMTWIYNSTTVIPVLLLACAAVALYKYPINKKVYEELLEQKNNN